jgi:MSHA biogenesis protein MshO
VDTADITLRRMQRDVRRALPNSIRTKELKEDPTAPTKITGVLFELLHTLDGGRYRADVDIDVAREAEIAKAAALAAGQPLPVLPTTTCTKILATPDLADDNLDFDSPPDSCFEVMGYLTSFDPTTTHGEFLYIYNVKNAENANPDISDPTRNHSAYLDMSDPASNRRPVTNSGDKRYITFTPQPAPLIPVPFPKQSPEQLFAIVDTPVTYYCDLTTQQLWRYDGYAIQPTRGIPDIQFRQLQADKIADCEFNYNSTAGLVSLTITLKDSVGDKVTLMHQIHVDNGS